MKKIAMLFLFAALLLAVGCSVENPMTPGDDAIGRNVYGSGEVKLLRANAYIHTKYGMGTYQRGFEVRVKNLAYDKQVAIWHKLADGTWVEVPCTYSRTADAGYEIWTGSTSCFNSSLYDTRFCVKATMNGQTFWDNNGGADYVMGHNDGVLLGGGVNVMLNSAWRGAGTISGGIDLRNIAYSKSVQVVWTTDNWATQSVTDATFVSSYSYGYAFVQSPNALGIERWIYTLNTSAAIKFYIRYTVNGKTYYDNKFGADYSL